jgi:hypothetical protein
MMAIAIEIQDENPLEFHNRITTDADLKNDFYALRWYRQALIDHPSKRDELEPRIAELERLLTDKEP